MTCIKINLDDYPHLNKIKKNELDSVMNLIFKTGYECIFPTNKSSDPLVNKITSLENTLERLIGIGSSKKGEMGEIILEQHIKSRYGDINYTDMSQTNHSGDAHITFDGNNTKIMLESKNYTNKVNKDEVEKMKFDMIHTNITWGIFLSWNSNIIDKREFDIEIFHEKGTTYHIIYISNLSSDIDRLDLAIQLVRKLINHINTDSNITWIYNMIQNDIILLNSIISKNYQLRLWFEEMETSMNFHMNKYYTKMRDYMFEMDQMIKTIVDRITNTTLQSIDTNHDIYNLYLEKFKDNKKMYPILSMLLDIMKQYKIHINEDNMIYKDIIIGNIKVMGKKIIVYWDKYKHTSELGIDKNVESFNMIRLFANSYSVNL